MGHDPSHSEVDDFAQHIDSLRALARGLVGDEHLAEDIVQDASLAALQAPPRERGALVGWLRRTVMRRASNALRARSRRRDHEELGVRSERTPGPEEIAFQVELQQRLLSEVQALPEAYREVLWLRYWKRLAPGEIAPLLGISLETVKTRLRRARERLREGLDRGGEGRAWLPALAMFAHDIDKVAAGDRGASLPWAASVQGILVLSAGVVLAAGWALWPASDSSGAQHVRPEQASTAEASLSAVATTEAERPLAARERTRAGDSLNSAALSVRVLWPEGAPVAEVGLILRPRNELHDELGVRVVDTDARGCAVFEELAPGSYDVEVFRGGRRSVVLDTERVELELRIRAGIEVHGLVTDSDGRPFPGASVWMSRGGASWLGGRVATRADEAGRFVLEHVNPRHSLLATAAGHAPSAVQEVSAFRGLAPEDHGFASRPTLVLERSGVVLGGRVRDAAGRGVGGARVAIRSPHWRPYRGALTPPPPTSWVTTATDGTYRVESLPHGALDVSVLAAGFAMWVGRCDSTAESGALDIELSRGFELYGQVLDARGAALAEATLQVVLERAAGHPEPAFALPRARTGADGTWQLAALPRGPLAVLVSVPGRAALGVAKRRFDVVMEERLLWNPRLSLEGTLHGRVVDENGHPCAGLMVRAPTRLGGGRGGFTDENGTFHLGPLPEEPLSLFVHPKRGFGTLARLERVEHEALPLTLIVPLDRLPSSSVRAQLVDEAGILPGAQAVLVEAEEFERRAGFARRVEGGVVDFTNMVPGRYRLRAFSGDSTLHIGEWFQLGPRETLELGAFKTRPLAALRMRLLGAPGEFAAARAELRSEALRIARYVEASRGPEDSGVQELVIDAVFPGTYELRIDAPGFVSHYQRLEVRGETEVQLTFEPGVEVQLVWSAEDPAWQQMNLELRDDAGSIRQRTTLFAGSELRLRTRLLPGQYSFELTTNTGWIASGPLTVPRNPRGPLALSASWSQDPGPLPAETPIHGNNR